MHRAAGDGEPRSARGPLLKSHYFERWLWAGHCAKCWPLRPRQPHLRSSGRFFFLPDRRRGWGRGGECASHRFIFSNHNPGAEWRMFQPGVYWPMDSPAGSGQAIWGQSATKSKSRCFGVEERSLCPMISSPQVWVSWPGTDIASVSKPTANSVRLWGALQFAKCFHVCV